MPNSIITEDKKPQHDQFVDIGCQAIPMGSVVIYFTHFYDNFNSLTRLTLIAILLAQSFWNTYALQCFFNDN
ncbi:hypothetical protein SKB0120_13530 [Moraxella osloensis]